MIKYSLICEKDHEFESWFANSESFDTQVKRGLVDCPHCGSKKVFKALMAPSVATARKKEQRQENRAHAMRQAMAAMPPPGAAPVAAPAAPVPASAPIVAPQQPVTLLDEKHAELRAAIRELHEKVVATSEDVGKDFPEQARQMHDGDIPVRSIRGEATFEEAKELWEEGIPVLPIPPLPEDRN